MSHSVSSPLIADLEMVVVDTNITTVEDNLVLTEALRVIVTEAINHSAEEVESVGKEEANVEDIDNGNRMANDEPEPSQDIVLNEDLCSEADVEAVNIYLNLHAAALFFFFIPL